MKKVFEPRKSQLQCIIFRRTPEIEFLLLKRNQEKGGFWQVITGGVKLDEEVVPAVVREVAEEISIAIHERDVIDLQYHFFFNADETTRFREDVFAVKIQPTDIVTISSEHTELLWLNFEEASKQIYWESNKKSLAHCYQYLMQAA